ncbi:MAG: hypothetical protein A3H39_16350 [candidate division NC10 bacterium RIFCSPLOWO2_02_FULL_66_22]|nr:MAG: hypothetical protein A3H39_16350 [candidate division NC10 bacterium RIFCSPLOWO2_02_FULL_66_22]
MKIISAKVLDPTHLELSQPIAAKEGDLIEISIPIDEDEQLWKAAAEQKFLLAYDPADAIYDRL